MVLEAAPISPVERAQNDLQKVIDRNTTPEAVDLRITTETTVTLDPTKGDQGFSYMAKRAYVEAHTGETDYSEKKALKAALLLSKLFMDATGDPKLKVREGDSLTIGTEKAVLTRKEKIGGKTVIKTYVVIVGDWVSEVSLSPEKPLVVETKEAEKGLKEEIAVTALVRFLNNLPTIRFALGLKDEDTTAHVLSTASLIRNARYPGYQFGTISLSYERQEDKTFFRAKNLEIGVGKTGDYIVLGNNGNVVLRTQNLEEIKSQLQNLMNQQKKPVQAKKEIPEIIGPSRTFEAALIKTLSQGGQKVNLVRHDYGVPDVVAFDVMVARTDGAKASFYAACSVDPKGTCQYQLADSWEAMAYGKRKERQWMDKSTFDQILQQRLAI